MPHDRKSRKIGVFMRRNARIGEKNRSTLDVLFKKTLTFDIARQQRSNQVLFDNDAASCYDRILVNLAILPGLLSKYRSRTASGSRSAKAVAPPRRCAQYASFY